jgi:tetratricopeptide (TPR) repeat protein
MEVEARLDYRGGLALYHRDPAWQTAVVEHFEFNLRRMIALCRAAGVPFWIVDPVCNLRGCPPFKAQHRDGLTDQQLSRWQELRREASERFRDDVVAATHLLEQAVGIDDQHAGLMYDLAKSYDAQGRLDDARQAYLRAKELDVCPLRITEPLRQAIHRACRDTGTRLLDVVGLFQRNCRDGIPGGYLLVDHVHPSITGHQMIAQLLMQRFWDEGLVKTDAAWAQRRDRLYAQHLASLDDAYYLEGQRRLEGLRKWAVGRATPRP